MKKMIGACAVGSFVLAILAANNAGILAGAKGSAYKQVIPADAVAEITKRGQAKLKGSNAEAAGVEASILYAVAQNGKGAAEAKAPPAPDLDVLMNVFRNKAKKGEGIHPDLHYHPKVKNQDGMESFVMALAAKKLSDENVAKVSAELALLSYRMAGIASLTYGYPMKNQAKWEKISIDMRDASFELAEAATAKNAEGIFAASKKLETTCIDCHKAYR